MRSTKLNTPVLILDKTYEPVKIATAKIAVLLLFAEKALVLDSEHRVFDINEWIKHSADVSDDNLLIRSTNLSLLLPEIVVLPNYRKKEIHNRQLRYTRSTIFKRDGFQCQYCGDEFNQSDLTVDHIIPKSLGGKSTWMNTTTACRSCNTKKSNKTLEEAQMRILNPPKIPTWRNKIEFPGGLKKELWSDFV